MLGIGQRRGQAQLHLARQQLEHETANLVSDIRSGLNRNVQTLQSLHTLGRSPGAWEQFALEVLEQHRELVRLEWRDRSLRIQGVRANLFVQAQRPMQGVAA